MMDDMKDDLKAFKHWHDDDFQCAYTFNVACLDECCGENARAECKDCQHYSLEFCKEMMGIWKDAQSSGAPVEKAI